MVLLSFIASSLFSIILVPEHFTSEDIFFGFLSNGVLLDGGTLLGLGVLNGGRRFIVAIVTNFRYYVT